MRKKWLINVSDEPDMINTTLDNGRSLRQLIIGVSLLLAFQAIRKSLKYIKFRLTTNQDLFQARSSFENVIEASSEFGLRTSIDARFRRTDTETGLRQSSYLAS